MHLKTLLTDPRGGVALLLARKTRVKLIGGELQLCRRRFRLQQRLVNRMSIR